MIAAFGSVEPLSRNSYSGEQSRKAPEEPFACRGLLSQPYRARSISTAGGDVHINIACLAAAVGQFGNGHGDRLARGIAVIRSCTAEIGARDIILSSRKAIGEKMLIMLRELIGAL